MKLVAIGEKLRARRRELRVSMTDLAHTVGCTRQNLYRIENGVGTTTLDTLGRICEALDLELVIDLVPLARPGTGPSR